MGNVVTTTLIFLSASEVFSACSLAKDIWALAMKNIAVIMQAIFLKILFFSMDAPYA